MSSLNAKEIERILREHLNLDGSKPLIVHVLMSSISSGQQERPLIAALLAVSETLIMPAFTYQTQVIPRLGPPDNAIEYGSGDSSLNAKAEIFRPDLSVHPDMGIVAETLRRDADSLRSTHPLLSFVAQGRRAAEALAAQSAQNPFGPIEWLEANEGRVLLIGADQRQNVSLHLAEQRAGRKTFVRWALTLSGVEELHGIPGCTEGFNDIWGELLGMAEVSRIGAARTELYPIRPLLKYVEDRIRDEPKFTLCERPSCQSCRAREVAK